MDYLTCVVLIVVSYTAHAFMPIVKFMCEGLCHHYDGHAIISKWVTNACVCVCVYVCVYTMACKHVCTLASLAAYAALTHTHIVEIH